MGQEERFLHDWSPVGAPLNSQRDDHWRHLGNSVHAVSFGFVATAILISMFLVVAIFERFLRPNSSHGDLESQLGFNGKLCNPSPKMTTYTSGVSVLMPGDEIPTFIALSAPVLCPPERLSLSRHERNWSVNPATNSL